MKIAQIITTLNIGGAEKQLLLLCRRLKQEGHDVRVAYMKGNGPMADQFYMDQIPVHKINLRFSADVSAFFRLRDWLRKWQPDLAHTHLFKADLYGGSAALALNIPLISSKLNTDPYVKNSLYAWVIRKVAFRSSGLIAISNQVRSYYAANAGIPERLFRVIPIGVEPIVENRKSASSGPIRIGLVGRMAEQKGHRVLFEALAKIDKKGNGLRVLLFGSGPLEKKLKADVQRLGLEKHVEFRGNELNLETLYSQFDILALPSLWEGAGNVLLEAMNFGIPIIASDTGGIPEYVTPECALLVPVGDSASLAMAIEKLTTNAELRARMGNAGRRHCRSFDFEHTAQQHFRMYAEVVEQA